MAPIPAARTSTTDPAPAASHIGREGLLLVDKPAGITSHDVVARVRRATRNRRVGHAGTLDPFATGLLVVLVGRGTRLIPYVDGEPKIYDATIRFGAETDTDDLTGHTTRESLVHPDDVALAEAIARLTGEIDQLPPAYSAKQVGGTRAYDAARRGTPLALEPARVMIHGWTLLDRTDSELRARVSCGAGTYIRALARDLGRLVGGAAHLAALRRVAAGPFSVDDAVSVDDLASGQFATRQLRDAVQSLPVRRLNDVELARVVHGNPVSRGEIARRVALVDDEETLIAIADPDGELLRPRLVLRDPS